MRMNDTLRSTIADNVKRLMELHGSIVCKDRLTTDDLAQLCKNKGRPIDQKTVWNVIHPEAQKNITIATVEAISDVFGLEPYHLMIPNLPLEELTSKRIEKMLDCYTKSSPAGRENIARIAENEMRYSAEQPKKTINGG